MTESQDATVRRGNLSAWTRRQFVTSAAVAAPSMSGVGALAVPAAAATTPRAQPQDRSIPAFPGAEGAGMYATGGRGGEVYEVTTLDDSGAGSLRDAVSGDNRTIVFRVSGTIELVEGLDITGSNLTIAGQTASGDGICVSRYGTRVRSDNVVIRYLRFRAGDPSQAGIDSFAAREVDHLVLDHCSFSWGVDETLSPYGNTNMTVQWCIIAEGLTMSAHEKGRHGYGGLWGGDNVTIHHNLFVHNGGRNPRFSFTEGMEQYDDFRNNLIYNYGHTSGYGGEWAEGINIVGNYYKPGPNTLASIAPIIFAPGRLGQWHVADNVIEGHPDVTEDNWSGIDIADGGLTRLEDPVDFDNEVGDQTAEDAYEEILENVGATLPRRDAVDARLTNDVRNGTGRMINSQEDVGGWPPLASTDPPDDSDQDGMPDDWEEEYGLDPNDPEDRNQVAGGNDGYTNLEVYLNSLGRVGQANPTVRLTSPAIDEVRTSSQTTRDVVLEADASAVDGASIAKVEFFAGAELVGQANEPPYRTRWTDVEDGTYYLTARATDDLGTATSSTCVPVHVSYLARVGSPWKSEDIGDVGIPGSASLSNGVYTVKGSGAIAGRSDAFHFLYQPLDLRDGRVGEIIARVDHHSREYVDGLAGLMIRENLSPDSPYMMIGLTHAADGQVVRSTRIARDGANASVGDMPAEDVDNVVDEGVFWLRLVKRGDEFEAFVSGNSLHWTRPGYERIPMADRIYIGLAVDGGEEANDMHHYTTARFSLLEVNQ